MSPRDDVSLPPAPPTHRIQFSLRGLFLFTAAVAGALTAGIWIPEGARLLLLFPITYVAGSITKSSALLTLSGLTAAQLMWGAMLQPADNGKFFDTFERACLVIDLFLFFRMYFYYRLCSTPEPELSWRLITAIQLSPIYSLFILIIVNRH